MNLIGFNLYRRVGTDGVEVKLNDSLIPAGNFGSMMGGSYNFTDHSASPGVTYTYRLECINTDFQPYDVRISVLFGYSIFLPVIDN